MIVNTILPPIRQSSAGVEYQQCVDGRTYGAVGDGFHDDTDALMQALQAAGALDTLMPEMQLFGAALRFTGSVPVFLPAGIYLVSGLDLPNRAFLAGSGWGTVIRMMPGLNNRPVIRNAPHAAGCRVAHLRIDGNKSGQTATSRSSTAGAMTINQFTLTDNTLNFTQADVGSRITISTALPNGTYIVSVESAISCTLYDAAASSVTGASVTILTQMYGLLWNNTLAHDNSVDEDFDTNCRVDNVLAWRCKDDGFRTIGRGDHRFNDTKSYLCDGNGYWFDQDVVASGITAGWSGLRGVYVRGSSVQLSHCKAFYSGQVTASSGDGFYWDSCVEGSGVGLVAQDNWQNGFAFNFASSIALSGAVSDSNNKGNTTGTGYDFWSSSRCSVQGVAVDNNRSATRQQGAVRLRTSSNFNRVHLSALANQGTNPYVETHSDSCVGTNEIKINATDGVQQVAFAASITPDPGIAGTIQVATLTGPITVANPAFPWAGQRMRLIFTQDGSGGRVVTLGNAFKVNWTPNTAIGKVNILDVQYDGTNWNQTGATVGL